MWALRESRKRALEFAAGTLVNNDIGFTTRISMEKKENAPVDLILNLRPFFLNRLFLFQTRSPGDDESGPTVNRKRLLRWCWSFEHLRRRGGGHNTRREHQLVRTRTKTCATSGEGIISPRITAGTKKETLSSKERKMPKLDKRRTKIREKQPLVN